MNSDPEKPPILGHPLSAATESGAALSTEEEFENAYTEAYKQIDHGITLVTQGCKAQVRIVIVTLVGLCK